MEVVKDMTAHQALLLEMLKDFDAVCRKHHISYQLFAGTALGAVRHHGFIPWDDDVDVILMPANMTACLRRRRGTLILSATMCSGKTARTGPCSFPSCAETIRPASKNIIRKTRLSIRAST